MMVFEVKLICPATKEIIYLSVAPKPQLPPPELFQRLPKPLMIINTKDSSSEDVKKAS